MDSVSDLYEMIKNNLNSDSFQENIYILQENDFIKACNDSIDILIQNEKSLVPDLDLTLEKSEGSNDVKEEYKLWTKILDRIYKLIEVYPNDTKKNKIRR